MVVSGLNHAAHQGDSYEDIDPPTKAQQEGWVSEQQRMNYKINEFALDATMWLDGAAELSAMKWAVTKASFKSLFTFGSKGASSINAGVLQNFLNILLLAADMLILVCQ